MLTSAPGDWNKVVSACSGRDNSRANDTFEDAGRVGHPKESKAEFVQSPKWFVLAKTKLG